jgi:hypothetical protein
MRIHHIAHKSLLTLTLGLALPVALAACSSGGSSSSSSSVAPSASATTSSAAPASSSPAASPSSTATATTTAAASGGSAATVAAIKKNWETFFNGKTPAATKVTLVQDGTKFAAVLQAAASNPSGATASATVQSVTLTSATEATVHYTILVSGTPMLAGQKGTAVLENGTWKVGVASFCALAALENSGKAPAGC